MRIHVQGRVRYKHHAIKPLTKISKDIEAWIANWEEVMAKGIDRDILVDEWFDDLLNAVSSCLRPASPATTRSERKFQGLTLVWTSQGRGLLSAYSMLLCPGSRPLGPRGRKALSPNVSIMYCITVNLDATTCKCLNGCFQLDSFGLNYLLLPKA